METNNPSYSVYSVSMQDVEFELDRLGVNTEDIEIDDDQMQAVVKGMAEHIEYHDLLNQVVAEMFADIIAEQEEDDEDEEEEEE